MVKCQRDANNPLKMVKDPLCGDVLVLGDSFCTVQRRQWFRRSNEILAFQMVAVYALKECDRDISERIPQLPHKDATPLAIDMNGHRIEAPARRIVQAAKGGVDVVARQVFAMSYGSFETYLLQLMTQSFPLVGREHDVSDESVKMLIGKSWRSKFAKMDSTLGLGHKDGELVAHFAGFNMRCLRSDFKHPLDFMSRIGEIRHRIVHASSIIDADFTEKYPHTRAMQGKSVGIKLDTNHEMYAFYALLTDYIDDLFARRFGFDRQLVNPATA